MRAFARRCVQLLGAQSISRQILSKFCTFLQLAGARVECAQNETHVYELKATLEKRLAEMSAAARAQVATSNAELERTASTQRSLIAQLRNECAALAEEGARREKDWRRQLAAAARHNRELIASRDQALAVHTAHVLNKAPLPPARVSDSSG